MFLLFLLVLIAAGVFLARRGHIGPPKWMAVTSPEAHARNILAERFANGDISSEEFMERASVLNWTPGVPAQPGTRPKRK